MRLTSPRDSNTDASANYRNPNGPLGESREDITSLDPLVGGQLAPAWRLEGRERKRASLYRDWSNNALVGILCGDRLSPRHGSRISLQFLILAAPLEDRIKTGDVDKK